VEYKRCVGVAQEVDVSHPTKTCLHSGPVLSGTLSVDHFEEGLAERRSGCSMKASSVWTAFLMPSHMSASAPSLLLLLLLQLMF
jgi:hypothetical protein